MTEKPLLLNGDMVRAVLAGRKTQTRRLLSSASWWRHVGWIAGAGDDPDDPSNWGFHDIHGEWHVLGGAEGRDEHDLPCSYGQPGDRLWVRETWQEYSTYAGDDDDYRVAINYRASFDEGKPGSAEDQGAVKWCPTTEAQYDNAFGRIVIYEVDGAKWRPSIHMPRWACRLVLEITDVRVERLQDIRAEDAVAEGIDLNRHRCGCEVCGTCATMCTATASGILLEFRELWGSIYGADSWAANPWVWAISFERMEVTP